MQPTMPAVPPGVEFVLLHDARAIHDTASFCFDAFVTDQGTSWTIAAIAPGPQSGSATVPNGYIESGTGKMVIPSSEQAVVIKEGAWRVIGSSQPSPSLGSGRYSWFEPMVELKRNLAPEDYYSPFTHGGTIIFRPMMGKVGIEQFGFAHLLFPDWSADMGPAFADYAAHPHEFDKSRIGQADAPRLMNLVSQRNRLLAAAAFRALLAANLVKPGFVPDQFARVTGPLCAIFTYLAIVQAGSDASSPWVQQVLRVLDTASASQMRMIALGAFAAGPYDSGNATALEDAKTVLRKVRQQLAPMRITPKQDPKLGFIFTKMGI